MEFKNLVEVMVLPAKVFNNLTFFTIAIWVKITKSNHKNTIISVSSSSNLYELLLCDSKITIHNLSGTINFPDVNLINEWFHIAYTRDFTSGEVCIYLNGDFHFS